MPMSAPSMAESITARNYHQRVLSFAKSQRDRLNNKFPTIDAGNPGLWLEYFDRHLQWRPVAFKWLMSGRIKAMTVPTEDPCWFDVGFSPEPGWLAGQSRFTPEHRDEMQRKVDRVMRPTYAQLKARYGNNWGIRSPDDRPARHAQFRTPAEISAEWEAEYQARRRPVPAEHPEEEIA